MIHIIRDRARAEQMEEMLEILDPRIREHVTEITLKLLGGI